MSRLHQAPSPVHDVGADAVLGPGVQVGDDARRLLDPAGLERPGDRPGELWEQGLDPPDPPPRVPSRHPDTGGRGRIGRPLGVRVAGLLSLGVVQQRPRVSPDGLEHAVPPVARRWSHEQGPLDEAQHVLGRVRAEHGLGRVEIEGADEHREPSQRPPVVLVQEVVGPVDRVDHGLVASRPAPVVGPQQVQPVVEPLAQRRQADHAHAARGELDGEGQAVEPTDELGDVVNDVGRGVELGSRCAGSFEEQRHRRRVRVGDTDAG